MPQVFRSSDVVEVHSERGLTHAFGAVALFIVAGLLFRYQGTTKMFVPLAEVLFVFGILVAARGIYFALQIRKVRYELRTCPFCNIENALTEVPDDDFLCVECHRLVPVSEGKVMSVSQVRCGYCNTLNYYSDKTQVLLCEECNHEIPIAHDDALIVTKKIATGYAVEDDDRPYELVLVAHGAKTDDLINALQHMLALNRGQVKQMLNELPVTLLTGVPKRKAEMMRAQLSIHDAAADCRPLDESVL